MLVKDVMTTELFTLREDHKLDLAKDVMGWQRIRHIPIVDGEQKLVGLVTHRDLLKYSVSSFANIPDNEQRELDHTIPIKKIMRKNVITLTPDTDLKEAAAMMIDEKMGCVPVTKDGKLVGIVTEADFLTLAWEVLGQPSKQKDYTSVRKYSAKAHQA